MRESDIAARIARFPNWHYQFELQGHRTPVADPATVNRHRQREAYFFASLLAECGGSLEGMRVLDLGCNAGLWSLRSVQARCAFVLGVDARAMHIEQAELVFEAHAIDPARYGFVHADALAVDLSSAGRFDVALCLGLLYHVGHPVGLMELVDRSGAHLVVVDTVLARGSRSRFQVHWDDPSDPRDAVGNRLVLWPTRQAVVDLAAAYGFQATELRPRFTDWTGGQDYRRGARRAFMLRRDHGGAVRARRRRRSPPPWRAWWPARAGARSGRAGPKG